MDKADKGIQCYKNDNELKSMVHAYNSSSACYALHISMYEL